MSPYALAFGILATGLLVAGFLWLLPRWRQRLKVRGFRKELAQVHLVSLIWRESLAARPASDEVPLADRLPQPRRLRRQNRPA